MSDIQKPLEEDAPQAAQGGSAESTEAVFKVAPGEGETGEGASSAPAFAPLPEPRVGPPTAPEPPPAPKPPPARVRRHPPSLFWPLVLIGAGVLLLLSNLGYVPRSSWSMLWRLWPVLLIALGVDVLIGRRSMAGAFVNGLLLLILIGGVVAIVFFAQNIPMLVELTQAAEWQVEHIEHPLDSIERATADIDWTSVPGFLRALRDSDNLIQGDVAYSGELVFDVTVRGQDADVKLDRHTSGSWVGPLQSLSKEENHWDVGLNAEPLWDLNLDAGSGRCDFDLSGLRVSALYLDVGSGTVELTLPPESSFKAQIEGGSGTLTIELPDNVGAQVKLESGSGAFRPGERFRLVSGERDDDGLWETENWERADYRIEFQIDQGSGRISFD